MRLASTIICLLSLTVVASLYAQEPWKKYGMIVPEMVASHPKDLALSAGQETKIRRSLTDEFAEAYRLNTVMNEKQQKFDEVMKKPDVSAAQALAALTESLDAEAAVEKFQLSALLTLRDELTPEQQAKAPQLSSLDDAEIETIRAHIDEKGKRLRRAFESLGFEPAAIEMRGQVIEQLGREGMVATAEWVLDQLIVDTDLDAVPDNAPVDFSKLDPGKVDASALQDRYAAVQERAQTVISLPMIRQLLKARDETEKAKTANDVVRAGRALTYAESLYKGK
jgi:hypothetical protein